MVKHIVMWKLSDFAEGAGKAENAEKIKTMLLALKDVIPQIKHIEVGIDITGAAGHYDAGLYSIFENEEDLKIYQDHPEHKKVSAFVSKVRIDRIALDFTS